jgi:hypothetical protein
MNAFLKLVFLFVFLGVGGLNASSSDYPEQVAYIFSHRGDDIEGRIRQVCARPDVTSINLYHAALEDDDLEAIFHGLVERQKTVTARGDCITNLEFLNITSDEITEDGFLNFLRLFEGGFIEDGKKIHPDIRGTVIRVGFDLTEKFLDTLRTEVPRVMAGGLRIVD